MTFGQAMILANKIGIDFEEELNGCCHCVILKDGTELYLISEYDGPLSDVTPGNGLELPSIHHKPAGSRLVFSQTKWWSIPEVKA